MSEVSSGLPLNFRKLIPVTSDGVKLSTSGNTPDCTNVLMYIIGIIVLFLRADSVSHARGKLVLL